MTLVTTLPLLMFAALLFLILLGFPVAFTLAGTALIFGAIGHFTGQFLLSDFSMIPARIWGVMSNPTLVAIPIFVFMGLVLEKSGIAEELLRAASSLLRGRRGSLAQAVILVGALLGASTGIVGATVVTMGLLALPTMIERRYDPDLSCGVIAASGTLGQIIPPSIVLVLLGDVMGVDVGDLFLGSLLPGLLLVALYALFVAAVSWLRPEKFPSDTEVLDNPLSALQLLTTLLAPLTLMMIVLGSIITGLASPTEAASCGAVGAVIIAAFRRKLTAPVLREVGEGTASITAMVFTILVGAQFFGAVFRGLHGDTAISQMISATNAGPSTILFFILLLMFFLGFFLDFLEICVIIVPIVLPALVALGHNKLWVAVLMALNLQTSFLTPPFGFALFYLKGVAPASIRTGQIYRGVIPFVIMQVLAMLLVFLWPELVTWLPKLAFKK